MIAAVERAEAATVATTWVTAQCSNRDCRAVLFRYQPPPIPDERRYVRIAVTCPSRRCRKAQEVRIPAGVVRVEPNGSVVES